MSIDAAPSNSSNRSTRWVTMRSHFQVSKTEVLPVIFKSPRAISNQPKQPVGPVPPAFPKTAVLISDSLDAVKEWLAEHMERMYRVGAMNIKPGSLETPDVLRSGPYRFTVWFEPTAATFALVLPKQTPQTQRRSENTRRDTDSQSYEGFIPTPQTLHIVGELERET